MNLLKNKKKMIPFLIMIAMLVQLFAPIYSPYIFAEANDEETEVELDNEIQLENEERKEDEVEKEQLEERNDIEKEEEDQSFPTEELKIETQEDGEAIKNKGDPSIEDKEKESSIDNLKPVTSVLTDKVTIKQHYNGEQPKREFYNVDEEDMVSNLEISVSGNDTILYDHVVKIELDKEFLHETEDIRITKPQNAESFEIVTEGDMKVIYIHFKKLSGGTTIQFPIITKFNSENTPNGYELKMNASLLDKEKNIVAEANEISFKSKHTAPEISKKSEANRIIVGKRMLDGSVEYYEDKTIKYEFQNVFATGRGRKYEKVILKDILPEGAVFDPEYESRDGKRTNKNSGWRLSEDGISVIYEGSTHIKPLYLDFPDVDFGKIGMNKFVKNKVEAEYFPLDKEVYETTYESTSETTTTLGLDREKNYEKEEVGLEKVSRGDYYDSKTDKNTEKRWTFRVWNHSKDKENNDTREPFEQIVLEDFDLDERLEFTQFKVKSSEVSKENLERGNFKVYAYLGDNNEENELTSYKYDDNSREYIYTFPNDVRGFKVVHKNPRSYFVDYEVFSKIKEPDKVNYIEGDAINNTFINTAKVEASLNGNTLKDEDSAKKELKEETFNIEKIEYGTTGNRVKLIGDEVRFSLDMNHRTKELDKSMDDKRTNVKIIDILPVGLTFKDLHDKNNVVEDYKIIDNYKNTGKQAIEISMIPEYIIKTNRSSVEILTEVNEFSSENKNENTNEMYMYFSDLENIKSNTKTEDQLGINDLERHIFKDEAQYTYQPAKEIVGKKSVKSIQQDNYSVTGIKSHGDIEYNLNIKNYLDYPTNDLTIYDLLPSSNDLNIVENQEGIHTKRGSEFNNKLNKPIVAPEGYTVYYTEETPNKDANLAIKEDIWKKELTDYSKVKAFKIIMNEDTVLKPGESIDFKVEMTVPIKETENGRRAYNSFAFSTNKGNSFVETNKVYNEIEKTDVTVNKKWNLYKTEEEEVTIDLLADNEVVDSIKLNADNNWKHTFPNLPVVNGVTDKAIDYTVEEVKIPGYDVSVTGNAEEGFTITNTEVVPQIPIVPGKTSVDVEKKWIGEAKDSVTINLLADGKQVATVELSEDNNWKHSFTDLPVVSDIKDKEAIEYTVEEVKVDGYMTSISGNAALGFVITNTEQSTDPIDPEEPSEPTDPTKPEKPSKPTDAKKPEGEKLPQTGEAVNLLVPVGIALIIMGLWTLFTKRRIKE